MAIRTYSETEEKIFKAAVGEFARYGKQGARIQAIAEEAGCNKALVHYYFRNKDTLYEEVFDYLFVRFFSTIHEAISDAPSFRQTLSAFVVQVTEFLKVHGPYPLLMMKEMDMDSMKERYENIMDEFGKGPLALFTEKMDQAVRNGEVRGVDPRHTFMTVLGACTHLFVAFPMLTLSDPGIEERREQLIEERKQHIIDLVYNGLNINPEKQ